MLTHESLIRSDDTVDLAFERDGSLIESEWVPSPVHRLVAREEDRAHESVYSPVDLASEDRMHLSRDILRGMSCLVAML